MATRVTIKGQVTIPKRIRELLGIQPGDAVEFVFVDGHVRVTPARKPGIEGLYGSLGRYRPRRGESEQAMMERVRNEVAHAAIKEGRPARHKRSSQVPPRG